MGLTRNSISDFSLSFIPALKALFDNSFVKAIINTDDVWEKGNVSVEKEKRADSTARPPEPF